MTRVSDTPSTTSVAGLSITIPYLPDDLVNDILDMVDTATASSFCDLCACSRVCRRWQLLTQPLIFRSITLHNMHKSPESRSLAIFCAFLAATPRICSYVKALSISKNDIDAPAYYILDMSILWRTISLLKRLEILSLTRVRLELQPGSSLPRPLCTDISLQELNLVSVSLSGMKTSFQGFYALLRMFTSVAHVWVHNMYHVLTAILWSVPPVPGTEDDDVAAGEPYPSIERMSFFDATPTGLLGSREQFAELVEASPNLRSAFLRTHTRHGLVRMAIMLPQLPSNLRDLRLFIGVKPPSIDVLTLIRMPVQFYQTYTPLTLLRPSAYDEAFSAMATSLTTFTCLHTFTFHGYPYQACRDNQDAQQCMDVIAQVLMSLPPTIVHLAFSVLFLLDHGAVSWEGIRAACRRFEAIQFISICFSTDIEPDDDQDYYQDIVFEEMKEFAYKGVLYRLPVTEYY